MSTLTDLITKVADYDPDLSDALKTEFRIYAQRRPFGLNFERHQPENVRLYGRPAHVGDLVNILPPRGTQEGPDNRRAWRITAIADGRAELLGTGTEEDETTTANVADLVTLSEFDKPIYPGLKETGRVERGGDRPYQVVINAENYHALKALLYPYKGKVDCIYIDPPYNTRDNDWKYNNDYVNKDDAYQHSKWLAMMERRLKLAKQLLNLKDSVLIVTIDEKEYLRLGLLLEQIFPDEEKIRMITSVTNPSGSSRPNSFSRCCEYLYVVSIGDCRVHQQNEDMLHPADTEREVRWDGFVRTGSDRLRSDRPNMFYPFFFSENDGSFVSIGKPVPLGTKKETIDVPDGCFAVFPMVGNEERRWRASDESARAWYKEGFLSFGPWKKGQRTRTIYYLPKGTRSLVKSGVLVPTGRGMDNELQFDTIRKKLVPFDVWNKPSHSATDYGSTLLGNMLHRQFPFPKSLYAVEDVLRFFVENKKEALILDFFAGSGTTAHAVMRLNHQDGGHRRCILVTNNEVSADEEKTLSEQGYRHGDPEWERLGICEYVTKPRVRAAITGKTPEDEPIKGDYKFTDEFPMAEGFEENAVFYELTYQNEASVELDQAFEAIAPLLWLKAGSRGRCITERKPDFDIADTYAILFDYRHVRGFLEELENHEGIRLACIVTDQESRFRDVAGRLPDGIEPLRLYESYLRSFRFMQGEE